MFQKVKRIIGIILLAGFLLTCFYIGYIRITDLSPNIFGYSFLRISTDSMEPELGVGEIVVVKRVEPATLKFGDVISYRADKGYMKGSLVTHQISKEPYEENGVYYFTTRGIKPEAVDDPEISDNQVIGKVNYKIPFAGTLFDFFTNWYGMVAFAVLILIIFSSDIIALIKKYNEKKNIDDDSDHKNSEDLRQSEIAMAQRLNEFDGIITDLEDPDL